MRKRRRCFVYIYNKVETVFPLEVLKSNYYLLKYI